MTFAFPLGLLALLSLPVIAALHLMRERTRRLPVSSLKLWDFLEPEVRGSKPRRIPITLLLILDLVIAALLALALSQPSLAVNIPAQSAVQYLILLDGSTSMLAVDALPDRFTRAKVEVSTLLNGLGAQDSASVIVFGASTLSIGDTRSATVQDILKTLYAFRAGGTGNSLAQALAVGMAEVDRDQPYQVHIYTDGTFSQPELGDPALPLTWHFYGEDTPNQAVYEISTVDEAGEQFQVFAQLANFSKQAATRNITLMVNGSAVDSFSQTLPPGSMIAQVWQRTGQADLVSVVMMGGDQLKEDDTASAGHASLSQPRIVLVEPQSESQSGLFKRVSKLFPEADRKTYSPQTYVQQATVDLTVFHGWLPVELPTGSVLILQPPVANSDLPAGLGAPSTRTIIPADATLRVVNSDPLIDGLDLSGVRWGEAVEYEQPLAGFDVLLSASFEGKDIPVILRQVGVKGRVYLVTANLEKGNLSRHPAFPIIILQGAKAALKVAVPPALQAGEVLPLPPSADYRSLTLIPPGSDALVFQQEWPARWTETRQSGTYRLELENSSGTILPLAVGINAGSPLESDIAPRPWTAEVRYASLSDEVFGQTEELFLAPWLLAAVILCLLWEAVVAWR